MNYSYNCWLAFILQNHLDLSTQSQTTLNNCHTSTLGIYLVKSTPDLSYNLQRRTECIFFGRQTEQEKDKRAE